MNVFAKFKDWAMQAFFSRAVAEEGIERFMRPQEERLRRLGVAPLERFALGHIAIKKSDFRVHFPGMMLRDMTDAIESGDTTAEEIIRRYNEKGF